MVYMSYKIRSDFYVVCSFYHYLSLGVCKLVASEILEDMVQGYIIYVNHQCYLRDNVRQIESSWIKTYILLLKFHFLVFVFIVNFCFKLRKIEIEMNAVGKKMWHGNHFLRHRKLGKGCWEETDYHYYLFELGKLDKLEQWIST